MLKFLQFCVLSLAILNVSCATAAATDNPYGDYLAGRHALSNYDFDVAASFFEKALATDQDNPDFLHGVFMSLLALGKIDRALPISKRLLDINESYGFASLVILAHRTKKEDFEEIVSNPEIESPQGQLPDQLARAWAQIGAGSVTDSLNAFNDVIAQNNLSAFGRYHKALALALVGDVERAEEVLGDRQARAMGHRGVAARIEILSQLDRNSDALTLAEEFYKGVDGTHVINMMRDLREGKKLPFKHIESVRDGIAEVFVSLASIYRQAGDQESKFHSLAFNQLAYFVRPSYVESLISIADIFQELRQFDLSIATYKLVPESHPEFLSAELGRANVLNEDGKPDAAIEVLEQLAQRFTDSPMVYTTLGGIYRQMLNYEEAVTAYEQALETSAATSSSKWYAYFVLGISHERLDQWPEAEENFRRALAIHPEEPRILNYLGYSMVEKKINLEEALEMIQLAVERQPDSGYIVDSLGWVLYRLNRYEESVVHMERAVELDPTDPTINDHLGDVYWAIGRYREAEFQWRRALSYADAEEIERDDDLNLDRIRRKLIVGLDIVLEEEGAPPLAVADDSR